MYGHLRYGFALLICSQFTMALGKPILAILRAQPKGSLLHIVVLILRILMAVVRRDMDDVSISLPTEARNKAHPVGL